MNCFLKKRTLFHIRNLINQTNVQSDPDKNMKAAEKFLLLMINTSVVAEAHHIITTESLQQLADMTVVNFVAFPKVDDLEKKM